MWSLGIVKVNNLYQGLIDLFYRIQFTEVSYTEKSLQVVKLFIIYAKK